MKSAIVYCWLAIFVTAPFMQGAQVPQQQNAPSKASIQGIVTRAGAGQPLKGVRISFRRLDGSQNPLGDVRTPVTTDAAGRFLVTGVDPGQYRISAERDGYIRQEYGQRTTTGSGTVISVAAGQRLELQFQMLPAGVISGRVSDEQGEPAARGEVHAWAFQYADGKRSLSQVANAQTNDIGEYRLFWLPPGEYLISVTVPDTGETATADLSAPPTGASRAVSEFVTAIGAAGALPGGFDGDALQKVAQVLEGREPAQIYFPGTLDPNGAAPIRLGAAVEMRAIDFTLRPIRTVTVRGRVVAPFPLAQASGGGRQGGPFASLFGQGTQVSLSRAGASPGFAALGLGGTAVNADGSFEIRGVAAGSYNLTATARPPEGQPYSARARVEVGDADVSNVVITVRPNISIRGSFVIDSAPQQFRMSQLRVALVPADGPSTGPTAVLPMIGGANASVDEDGAFTLQNVAAQEYRLLVTGLPAGTYLVAGRFGSADVLNGPFIPAENERNSLQLQLGSTPGRVSGIVRDAKGSPYTGALAALVPDESRRGRTDLYSSIPTDQSGRFSFNNVAPGNYRIFAWEEIPTGAFQDPDYIRRFESRGKPVVVQQSGSTEIEVSLIPAN
jgi:hypothetical protein